MFRLGDSEFLSSCVYDRLRNTRIYTRASDQTLLRIFETR